MSEVGHLVLCATPIGNLGDTSTRLRETLAAADAIYAEDTRRTRVLLDHLGVVTKARSLFVGNEETRGDEVLDALAQGQTVALVSDAGTPVVSDPGSEVVMRARAQGHRISVVPGPSAVTAAIALAGMGGDRFVFEGFLPRKGEERANRLDRIAADDRPTVLFVSPHRLLADLKDLAEHTGLDRRIVVARELTKLHEEIWVGTVSEALAEWDLRAPKGEFSVVVGAGRDRAITLEQATEEALALVAGGISSSEAARQVAKDSGLRRRDLYQAILAAQERS